MMIEAVCHLPITWFMGGNEQPEVVPDDLQEHIPGAQLVLREWREYRLTIPDATRLRVGNVEVLPFKVGEHLFSVTIENKLGPSLIQPYYGDHWGEPVVAEVIASKFGSVRESIAFMSAIVDELSGHISDLPFVATAETLRQVQRAHGSPSLLFSFHYLRHHGEDLLRALQIISADPHRALTDVVEDLRIDQARRIDAEAIHSLLRGPRAGEPNRDPGAAVLERLQPLRITTTSRRDSQYSRESFRCRSSAARPQLIAEIRAKEWWSKQANSLDLDHFDRLDRSLRRLLLHDPWKGIPASISFPAYSRVLQSKPGYRDLTRFWNGLSQINEPVLQALDKAIDLRDVPTLYEYWLYFALAKAIETHTNIPAMHDLKRDDMSLAWGMQATFPGVGRLLTQEPLKSYTSYKPCPDFVWHAENGRTVVLDAKFAMTKVGEFETDGESTTTKSQATTRDITKMHAYRDAIDGVTAALVLFPGTNGRFWNVDTSLGDIQIYGIENVIAQVISGTLDGIGAIPMSPIRGVSM
ncbi:MAG: DUF2357 domain-containing protein [Thermomicrobiales bacterium]|nr:DUF2357 domain-containing protein [Thermomicrobiales bacterium]